MIISNATLGALRTNFSALFQKGYGSAPVFYDKLATTIPAKVGITTFGFLDRIPSMRKWVGQRVVNNLKEQAAVIVADNFEDTVAVDRNDVEDDTLGTYAPLMEMLGFAAKKNPDRLLKTALQAGTVNTGFDGSPFFSNLHVLGAQAAQSNNLTGTALTPANYATTYAAMMSTVGADGESLGVIPDTLVVSPQLANMGRTILNAELINDGANTTVTNTLRGSAQLLVVPELSNQPTTWYLAQTSLPIKPFAFVQPRAPEFVMKTSSSDDNVFFDRQLVYGVDSREAIGYGLWWLCFRAIA